MRGGQIVSTILAVVLAACGSTGSTGVDPPVTTSVAPATTSPPNSTSTSTTTTAPALVSTTTIPVTTITASTAPDTGAEPNALVVPSGPTPTLDGVIGDDEWAGAASVSMDDGGELLWLHAAGSLYLGVPRDDAGSLNLLLADTDGIRVLHASAALGSAAYEEAGDGTWNMIYDFDWCCRSTSDFTARDALFDTERWTAALAYSGVVGNIELRVEHDGGPLWVAVSWVNRDAEVAVWPAGLTATSREPLYGARLPEERFAVGEWVALQPGG